jgi:uncharacterized membrane protein HdeD (DUF308 family)
MINAAPARLEHDDVSSSFWLVFVLGTASILLGIAVLAWPGETVRVLAVLLGIWLMVMGVARIIGAFVSRRGLGRQVLSGIVGVLLVIAGVACLRDVAKGTLVLAFVIALTWIFSGLAELVVAVTATGATRAWLLLVSVLSIAIGFVFLLAPEMSLTVLVILTGVSALLVGIAEVLFAFQLRRLASAG